MHTAELLGPIEHSYELQTNDPKHPILKLTAVANVKPLPAFVKRISNADVQFGEIASGFVVWPTLRPALTMERGEKIDITLRLRPQSGNSATLALAPDAPKFCKLRHDKNSNTYWLDMTAGPADAPVKRSVPLITSAPNGASITLTVNLAIEVPAANLIVSPSELDLGDMLYRASMRAQQKWAGPEFASWFGSSHQIPIVKHCLLSSSTDFVDGSTSSFGRGSIWIVQRWVR